MGGGVVYIVNSLIQARVYSSDSYSYVSTLDVFRFLTRRPCASRCSLFVRRASFRSKKRAVFFFDVID